MAIEENEVPVSDDEENHKIYPCRELYLKIGPICIEDAVREFILGHAVLPSHNDNDYPVVLENYCQLAYEKVLKAGRLGEIEISDMNTVEICEFYTWACRTRMGDIIPLNEAHKRSLEHLGKKLPYINLISLANPENLTVQQIIETVGGLGAFYGIATMISITDLDELYALDHKEPSVPDLDELAARDEETFNRDCRELSDQFLSHPDDNVPLENLGSHVLGPFIYELLLKREYWKLDEGFCAVEGLPEAILKAKDYDPNVLFGEREYEDAQRAAATGKLPAKPYGDNWLVEPIGFLRYYPDEFCLPLQLYLRWHPEIQREIESEELTDYVNETVRRCEAANLLVEHNSNMTLSGAEKRFDRAKLKTTRQKISKD